MKWRNDTCPNSRQPPQRSCQLDHIATYATVPL